MAHGRGGSARTPSKQRLPRRARPLPLGTPCWVSTCHAASIRDQRQTCARGMWSLHSMHGSTGATSQRGGHHSSLLLAIVEVQDNCCSRHYDRLLQIDHMDAATTVNITHAQAWNSPQLQHNEAANVPALVNELADWLSTMTKTCCVQRICRNLHENQALSDRSCALTTLEHGLHRLSLASRQLPSCHCPVSYSLSKPLATCQTCMPTNCLGTAPTCSAWSTIVRYPVTCIQLTSPMTLAATALMFHVFYPCQVVR